MNNEIVWLTTERCYARIMQQNAHFAVVEFEDNGEIVTLAVNDDDYEYWEERTIDYECE